MRYPSNPITAGRDGAAGDVRNWTVANAPAATRTTRPVPTHPRQDRACGGDSVSGARPASLRAYNGAPHRGHAPDDVRPVQSQRRQSLDAIHASDHVGTDKGDAYGRASPAGAGSSTMRRPSGSRGSGSRSRSGNTTNARSCMRGCGMVRRGSSERRSPHSRMSISIVRGPQRTSRTRPSSASTSLAASRTSTGESSPGSTSTTTFRNSGWSVGPPTGAVAHTREHATVRTPRRASRSTACCRAPRRSPRFAPSPRKTRGIGSLRAGDRRRDPVDAEARRRVRLVHDDGRPSDGIERDAYVGDRGGHRLDQVERPLLDHRTHALRDPAIVGGSVDLVAGHLDLEVEIDDERLRLVLLAGARTVMALGPDARQEQARSHALGPTSWSAAITGSASGSSSMSSGMPPSGTSTGPGAWWPWGSRR